MFASKQFYANDPISKAGWKQQNSSKLSLLLKRFYPHSGWVFFSLCPERAYATNRKRKGVCQINNDVVNIT